ncbi:hypothetical protein FUAX_53210 (plasmid) [Fulvitalea axinellae]|uniref:YD repeat-containing protein n=1 Tax=Fulvitalea axinellae TaxID=1182444 RepID=A0AAU9DEM5_9BACT|nr:hypothetical protein FUAX_53210 [Fulvitalea axinellae]
MRRIGILFLFLCFGLIANAQTETYVGDVVNCNGSSRIEVSPDLFFSYTTSSQPFLIIARPGNTLDFEKFKQEVDKVEDGPQKVFDTSEVPSLVVLTEEDFLPGNSSKNVTVIDNRSSLEKKSYYKVIPHLYEDPKVILTVNPCELRFDLQISKRENGYQNFIVHGGDKSSWSLKNGGEQIAQAEGTNTLIVPIDPLSDKFKGSLKLDVVFSYSITDGVLNSGTAEICFEADIPESQYQAELKDWSVIRKTRQVSNVINHGINHYGKVFPKPLKGQLNDISNQFGQESNCNKPGLIELDPNAVGGTEIRPFYVVAKPGNKISSKNINGDSDEITVSTEHYNLDYIVIPLPERYEKDEFHIKIIPPFFVSPKLRGDISSCKINLGFGYDKLNLPNQERNVDVRVNKISWTVTEGGKARASKTGASATSLELDMHQPDDPYKNDILINVECEYSPGFGTNAYICYQATIRRRDYLPLTQNNNQPGHDCDKIVKAPLGKFPYDPDNPYYSYKLTSNFWQSQKQYALNKTRENTTGTEKIKRGGLFSSEMIDHQTLEAFHPENWIIASELTGVDIYGQGTESVDALGVPSSVKFSDKNERLVIAEAVNAKERESCFVDFEVDGLPDNDSKTVYTTGLLADTVSVPVYIANNNILIVDKSAKVLQNQDRAWYAHVRPKERGTEEKWLQVNPYCSSNFSGTDGGASGSKELIYLESGFGTDQIGIWEGRLYWREPIALSEKKVLTTKQAHSGNSSLAYRPDHEETSPKVRLRGVRLEHNPTKKYMLAGWFKLGPEGRPQNLPGHLPKINLQVKYKGDNNIHTLYHNGNLESYLDGGPINGWYPFEWRDITFSGGEVESLTVVFGSTVTQKAGTDTENNKLSIFVDDVRFHPQEAQMKTYVYEKETHRLSAILDENNYATFYRYDPEGKLFLLQKETAEGVMTLQESVNHIPAQQ